MRRVIQGALIVPGLIHFLPVAGVIGADQLTSMYAIPFTDPNLLILMRHRAVMLGVLGGRGGICQTFPSSMPLPSWG